MKSGTMVLNQQKVLECLRDVLISFLWTEIKETGDQLTVGSGCMVASIIESGNKWLTPSREYVHDNNGSLLIRVSLINRCCQL